MGTVEKFGSTRRYNSDTADRAANGLCFSRNAFSVPEQSLVDGSMPSVNLCVGMDRFKAAVAVINEAEGSKFPLILKRTVPNQLRSLRRRVQSFYVLAWGLRLISPRRGAH